MFPSISLHIDGGGIVRQSIHAHAGTYSALKAKPSDWLGNVTFGDILAFRDKFGHDVRDRVLEDKERRWLEAHVQRGWPHNHQYT